MQSPATILGVILAMGVLILAGVGFSLFGSAKPHDTLTSSLSVNTPGVPLAIPNSAKSPFILTTAGDHDQQLVFLDKRRGSRVLVPSVRAVVQLQSQESYLILYAYPKDGGSLYFLEVTGTEQKPVRYWAMNLNTLGFHSLRVASPAHGVLSPDEQYVAYATGSDARGELRELHALAFPLDIEKPLVILGGDETLTIAKNKYTNEPLGKIEWKNDKTVSFGVSSSEFPISDGRPISETRTIEIR